MTPYPCRVRLIRELLSCLCGSDVGVGQSALHGVLLSCLCGSDDWAAVGIAAASVAELPMRQ